MDGLTISTSERMLETGKTVSQLRNDEINKQSVDKASGGPSFADTLKNAVNSVNEINVEADVQMQKLATGEQKNIAEVMIQVEKASVAMKLLTQVRNKIIDAYQEVMKMQV